MPLGHEHNLTRFHPEFYHSPKMINLFAANNGANRLPYLGDKPVLGHAHGGFSSGTPKGDFQSMIASPWCVSAQLLVPVIAFL
jgi:hypothetical protein